MKAPSFWAEEGITARLLSPAGVLFGVFGRCRWRLANPVKAGIPVVCVGNLVAGGAGKTPVALSFATLLQQKGYATHFLSRGYGGTIRGPHRVDSRCDSPTTVGDEALLLAVVSPTWISIDRVAGARAAAQAGAEIVVMDDGFQNPSLAKDLSVVVVDGNYGFGNHRLIPAGPLREPVADGLARADTVAILGVDHAGVREQIPDHVPVITGKLVAGPEGSLFSGRRVLAFAGIGRPEKFFGMLEELGCDLVGSHTFPDHHHYRKEELLVLADEAQNLDATLITTAKDAVRVPAADRGMIEVLTVTVSWDDTSAIHSLLSALGR